MTRTLTTAVPPTLRLLLLAFAATSAAVLGAILLAGPASAAQPDDTDVPTPVADLLDDVTHGGTEPLTDALRPVTAPVEAVVDQVAPAPRPVQDPREAIPAPDHPSLSASSTPTPRASDGSAAAGAHTAGGSTAAPMVAAPSPATTPSADDATDSAAAPDLSGLADEGTGVSRDHGESVDVDDLDFGPRPPMIDQVALVTSVPAVAALDHLTRVAPDDVLLEVRVPRDTGATSQTFMRPDVSPG